jgi:general secretion pathway protein K
VRLRSLATDQRGFALLAVTLVLALLGVVVSEFAFSMRLEAAMVRSYKDAILARHLAEAGFQQAVREILSDATVHGLDDDGQVAFFQAPPGTGATPTRLPELPRSHVKLGSGEFSYRITDEEGRVSINSGLPDRLDKLLTLLGLEKEQRDIITDSVEDWRDANDTHRANGVESDEYLKLPVPYRARNANLQDVSELLQIKGITPDLYYGHGDQPGLVDLVAVRTRGPINLNTAPKITLQAWGLADAQIEYVMQSRQTSPFSAVPATLTAIPRAPLTFQSATFRIEAEGVIGGEPRARLLAIVQRTIGQQTGGPPALSIFTWRWLPPKRPVIEGAAKS